MREATSTECHFLWRGLHESSCSLNQIPEPPTSLLLLTSLILLFYIWLQLGGVQGEMGSHAGNIDIWGRIIFSFWRAVLLTIGC